MDIAASVTRRVEVFVATMCPRRTRLRSESEESIEGKGREETRGPRGGGVVA